MAETLKKLKRDYIFFLCLLCFCVPVYKKLQNTKKLYNHNPDIIEYYFQSFLFNESKLQKPVFERIGSSNEKLYSLSHVDKKVEHWPQTNLISYIFVIAQTFDIYKIFTVLSSIIRSLRSTTSGCKVIRIRKCVYETNFQFF